MKKTAGILAFFDTIPSLDQALPELGRRLETDSVLAVLSLDFSDLIESGGAAASPAVFRVLDVSLRDFCAYEIRRDDMAVVEHPSARKGLPPLHIFLSKSREKWHAELADLENIAIRAHEFLYNRLFPILFPVTGHGPCLYIGYDLNFHAPARPPEAVIHDLIAGAGRISRFLGHKVDLLRRLALQDVLRNLRVVVGFQPIVSLIDAAVVGYAASAGGQAETFLENTCHLGHYARECGVARELAAVGRRGIVVKAGVLDRTKLIFLSVTPDTICAAAEDDAEFRRLLSEHAIDTARLVFVVPLRDLRLDQDFPSRTADRFPESVLAVELDETWDGADLPWLANDRIRYIMAGRESAGGALAGLVEEDYLQALVAFARVRGKNLIVTGVSHQATADRLRTLGAALGAGTWFARNDALREELALVNTDLRDRYQQKKLLLSIYLKRGREYFQRPDYDKAVLEFSKVLEIDPVNADSLYYRGYSYAADGVPAMAVRDLLKLREIDPEYPHLLLLEACIAESKGDKDRALRAYSEYMTRAARSFDAETTLAQTRIKKLTEDAP
jgi:EAL domain-containing protein (putative c-di-GMP-specific phosphodiesterase class I)